MSKRGLRWIAFICSIASTALFVYRPSWVTIFYGILVGTATLAKTEADNLD